MVDSKIFGAALALAALLAVPAPAPAADDPAARALVRDAWHESSRKTAVAELTLATETGGSPRSLEMRRMREGDFEKINLTVESPYNYKGMRYIFLAHDHYSYLPAMRRTLRIAEDSLSQPFLNSTFFVVDLVPPNLDDHEYAFVGEETVDGRACKLVESRKKGGGGLYGKSILAIDPADKLVVRTQFFDQNEKPLKTWTIAKLEKIDDVWTAVEQLMTPADGGEAWRLSIENVEYGVPLGEADFATVGLDR